jgi:hypothetical protein
LVIPFLPTARQRIKLERALQSCDGPFHIADSDELGASLFKHGDIVSRFFPGVSVIRPSRDGAIGLGYPDSSGMLHLNLHIHSWNESLPLIVSPSVKIGSILQLLLGQLSLPIYGTIMCVAVHYYEIRWVLLLERRSPLFPLLKRQRRLKPDRSLSEERVSDGATVSLRYEISHKSSARFMGASGSYVNLRSYFETTSYDVPDELEKYDDMMQQRMNLHMQRLERVTRRVAGDAIV